MGLLNAIIIKALETRQKHIALFRDHAIDCQFQLFADLIKNGEKTEWGIKYQYSSIKNYQDFQNQVPISKYEDLYPWIEQVYNGKQNVLWNSKINWFSKSSGTTNAKSKFIPVSKEALKSNHYAGGKDLFASYFEHNPNSKVFDGKNLGIVGTYTENPDSKGTYIGDISAVIVANLPKWGEYGRVPSLKLATLDEWESKIQLMAEELKDVSVTNIHGVPTWTVVLLEKILEITGKQNMMEVWPHMEVFFHGAVAFHPYRETFKKLFQGDQVSYFETYNASEGFFAYQDRGNQEDMLLMTDHGIFYEFIPIEDIDADYPRTYTLDQVEKDQVYAIVISTNSGLWRYNIGDTVRFTSTNPYRIKIAGRTKHFINAFGEELMIENAEMAITETCKQTNAIINNFTAGPVYFSENSKGAHEWVIEFKQKPSNEQAFKEILDLTLKKLNSDYEAKRYKNMALAEPIIHFVDEGFFYNWMKSRGKLGGQNKVPRLANNREFLDDILKAI